jgi:predicted CopG family antitoxin
MLNFEAKDISLADLLLDPNNYRFLDNRDYKRKPKNRYASEKVQTSTLRLLSQDKRYQLSELKKSILTNGYVPMERIIVIPYDPKPGKFLVVEGNRRVAALKSLLQDDEEGVIELSEEEKASFKEIPCAILKVPANDRARAERIIMGIRHIAGPREWGAYQQAQLVKELHDQENQDFAAIGEHLGISTVEVARRYRAMTALKGMEDDELYSEKSEPEFYRLFHELVSLPDVRVRFGWDSESNQFTDQEKAREFFELVAPQTKEALEAKLKAYSDVRKLKLIVGNPVAEEVLLDPTKTFAEALAEATQNRPKIKEEKASFSDFLKEALERVKGMTRQELKELNLADKKLIKSLVSELNEIIR